MPSFPTPTPVATKTDLRTFFDGLAANPTERHGPAESLLAHRLQLLDHHAEFQSSDVVLDVGCGDGTHLDALADRIDRGIGIDLSTRMIAAARRRNSSRALSFRVDDAERLRTISTNAVDKVICVGVLEHVLTPRRALQQMARVLKPTGRFVILTLNGAYWWYRFADQLGLPTRHLTTDCRFTPTGAEEMLRQSGLRAHVDFWRFVPRGDVPRPLSLLCRALDAIGQHAAPPLLRGGLRLSGRPL